MLSFTLLIKENSIKIERELKPMILDISQENKYTETEKEVIDYLMNHLDLLDELSISDLAKKTYTSNATIIRLCRKAGYRYPLAHQMHILRYDQSPYMDLSL